MDPALTDEERRDHIKAMRIHIRNFIICTDQGPDQKAAQAYIDNDVRSQLTCFVWRQWCFQCIDVSGTAESESPIPWDGPWHHCSRYGYEFFGGDDSSEDL